MKPAVYLDRDGTILAHVHHLRDPRDVRLIAGVADAIRAIRDAGYACVIVTNQSVVGRGLLTMRGLERIHAVMLSALLEHGAVVDAVYACPIAPAQDDPLLIEHPERKPGPMMLLRAASEHGLDVARSWMVGDSLSDMLAGRNAGCRGTILVRTGKGRLAPAEHPAIDQVAEDLRAAAGWIVSASADPAAHGEPAPAGVLWEAK